VIHILTANIGQLGNTVTALFISFFDGANVFTLDSNERPLAETCIVIRLALLAGINSWSVDCTST
jgi:hypothetical protein